MLRSKLLMLIMSGALIFASCSDSGTDSDNGGENGNGEEETVEPTASVNNPSDGATLKGEITFSIDGDSESGFDELRIFVGEEQVETIDSPSLPYEHTITTYNYNNGDYDLKAELDAAEPDTTIEASISVTLENYMVSLDTDGYIKSLKDNNDAAYMFIADPQGNVLREIELTSLSDGMHKYLPPSSIDGSAPDHFTYTLARKTTDYQGNNAFYLDTDAGLESWSTLQISRSSSSSGGSSSTTDLTVEMSNFDQSPRRTWVFLENFPDYPYYYYSHSGDLSATVPVPDGSKDMFITHIPDWETVSNFVPKYRWENDPTSLSSPVSYNVSQDFKEMVPHAVSTPSNVEVGYYSLWMTIAQGSFDEGDMGILWGYPSVHGDANGSDSGFGIWKPQAPVVNEKSFITYMQGLDPSNSNIRHRFQTPVMDGFPNEFPTVDTDVQFNNQSLDNLDMNINGSGADYLFFSADASTDSYTSRWYLSIPDTMETFVYPKIADSLDSSVSNYNRSDFQFDYLNMVDSGPYEDYSDYLADWYGGTDFGDTSEFYSKIMYLNTSSKVTPQPSKIEGAHGSSFNGVSSQGHISRAEQDVPYRNR